MDEDIARRVYSDPVARWFVTEAYRITDTAELVAAAGEQLVLSGIPLYRLAYFQLTLHPGFAGKGYTWRRGRGVETGTRPHGDNQDPDYRDNPLPPVLEQQKTVRVRLDRVEPQAPLLRTYSDRSVRGGSLRLLDPSGSTVARRGNADPLRLRQWAVRKGSRKAG